MGLWPMSIEFVPGASILAVSEERNMRLGPGDRMRLARKLLKSIEEEDDFKLTDEQKRELLRREKAHRKNPENVISWETVKAEMDAKYR